MTKNQPFKEHAMSEYTPSAQAFVAARDFLQLHRADYARAYDEFVWPRLDNFNWALDYFDVMARGNKQIALWITDDPVGAGAKFSFAQMAERSARVANFLRAQGVRRGDRILLMLDRKSVV
jgi:acetyl-CoA synthetase